MHAPVKLAIASIAAALALTACSSGDSTSSATKKDNAVNDQSYSALVNAQPAHAMTFSPSRNTINFWIDTWNKPNQLSYNYLVAVDSGKLVTLGYYALIGPPVSMCAAITPPQKVVTYDGGADGAQSLAVLPQPGIDGVYYSGGQCNDYYGKDATTGQYVEYTVPFNMMVRTYNQPLSNVSVPNLGPDKS